MSRHALAGASPKQRVYLQQCPFEHARPGLFSNKSSIVGFANFTIFLLLPALHPIHLDLVISSCIAARAAILFKRHHRPRSVLHRPACLPAPFPLIIAAILLCNGPTCTFHRFTLSFIQSIRSINASESFLLLGHGLTCSELATCAPGLHDGSIK